MTKNLFRVNFTDPNDEGEKEYAEKHESFKETDKLVSAYFPFHSLDIPIRKGNYHFLFGRDIMVEWPGYLFVKEALFKANSFNDFMKKLDYHNEIFPQDSFSEGGCFVFGENFWLISDIFEKNSEVISELQKRTDVDIPFYFMPSISSVYNSHIDCDYQMIDKLKLLYINQNITEVRIPEVEKARKRLEDIARMHNYDIREYPSLDKEDIALLKKEDLDIDEYGSAVAALSDDNYKFFLKSSGINFISTGSLLLTGFIHDKEKEFLESKGLEVKMLPIGKVNCGAGLRCIYGEFSL
jgi:hypothetical protein